VEGKRHGKGISIFDGKHGYDRWEGWFVGDKADGVGTMFLEDGEKSFEFEFEDGRPMINEVINEVEQ